MLIITKRLRAFTLIELLIVITIIGILAVAIVPRITGGPAKARDAQRKADLQQIATALEFYADDNGSYPATGSNSCVSDLALSSYLTTMPNEPQSGNGSGTCTTGYEYQATTDGYVLSANLESLTSAGDNIYEKFSIDGTITTSDNIPTVTTECAGSCTDPTYYVFR